MSPAVALSLEDIKSKLGELLAEERRHYLFALRGTGDEHRVHVATEGRGSFEVQVIPVQSELDLRRRLLDVPDDACAAFLVPWDGHLPMDLAGRFARGGRISAIGRDTRLQGLFDCIDMAAEIRDSPLVDYLLAHHAGERFRVGGFLTVDGLWNAWLARACGVDLGADGAGELALDTLLGWAATDAARATGPALVRTLEARDASAVRDALLAHLGARLGPAGPLVWRGWESGRGGTVLELAILAAASTGVDDPAVASWWATVVRELDDLVPEAERETLPAAMAQLAAASEPALRALQDRQDQAAVRRRVEAADRRLVGPVRAPLAHSQRLPSAWAVRLDRLGCALSAGAAACERDPTGAAEIGDAARDAADALRSLAGHTFFGDAEHTRLVERAEMAGRLLGWLATRRDRDLLRAPQPYAEVEALGHWYTEEGGWVDWARRWARGRGDDVLARGIAEVVSAADRVRDELDAAFARALPAYLEAGRPERACVPIDRAIDRIGGRFLNGGDARRLLVLLMDGMAWAQAVEILASLGASAIPWAPLDWHAMSEGRLGEAAYPPVLASFPTVTEVSRSAFFAGAPVKVGVEHKTADDPERWKKNPLARAHAAEAEPCLLLRGEGHTRDGSAADEALSLVGDSRRRIVGIVINVIDSSLKGDAAQRIRWTHETIKPLRDLLDAAAEVGRTVLLCADHGHVPADRLEPAGPAKKNGARWRVWENPEDPVADYELALPAARPGVWAPRGAHGVILLTDERRKYGGGASAGEHGGASLAEVVAPCLLIGREDHVDRDHDPALGVSPLLVPGWWHFDLGQPGGARAGRAEPAAGRPRRKRGSENQLPLPQLGKTPELVPAPSMAPAAARPGGVWIPDMSAPLARSRLLDARAGSAERKRGVVAAVQFLLSKGGAASAEAFAAALGEFPTRVAGRISKLQEVLNADGYPILRFERRTKQVHLDAGTLAAVFDIET